MHPLLLKVRNRIAHRLVMRAMRPQPGEDLVRLGSDYGGWWVPASALKPAAVAYCGGAGEDITFDLGLLERGLVVRTFDPTPRSIDHVASLYIDSDRFQFLPVGWGGESGKLRFYAPRDPSHVSHSTVNLQGTSDYFEADVRPIHELMAEIGDAQVDIVKMDIEGSEYRVLSAMEALGPKPSVLCIEFDQPVPPRRVILAVRRLEDAGYVLRKVDRWNFTFTLDS